jgi:hypothetical protein
MKRRDFQETVLRELREIRAELKEIKEQTSRMSGHVNFVERVYETVRSPFSWILSKVPTSESIEMSELPKLIRLSNTGGEPDP